VVDDDSSLNKLVSAFLLDEGYSVLNAFDGVLAIELFQSHHVNVVILDQEMPNMDGLETLKRLIEIDASVSVIMITGYASHEPMEEVKDNVVDYILKPFELDDLKLAVYRALKHDELLEVDVEERLNYLEDALRVKTFALRNYQIDYKQIIENSLDLVIVIESEIVRFLNNQAMQVLGCDLASLQDRDIAVIDFIHPEDKSLFFANLQICKKEHMKAVVYEMRMLKKDGSAFLVQMSQQSLFWQGEKDVLCVARDVSERAKAVIALETRLKYEKLLNEIVKSALQIDDINVFKQQTIDIIGREFEVSRSFIFEYASSLKLYTNTVEWAADTELSEKLIYQDIPEKNLKRWSQRLKSGQIINLPDVDQVPDVQLKKMFQSRNMKSVLAVPLISGSKYLGFIGFDERRYKRIWEPENITILNTAAHVLTSSMLRWETERLIKVKDAALDSSISGMALASLDGLLFYVNRAFLDLWHGNNTRCFIDKKFSDLWLQVEDGDYILSQLKLNGYLLGEFSAKRYDGSMFIAQITASMVELDKDLLNCIIFSFIDISDQKEMEKTFLRSSKLSSLGQMAAGLAHELRNPLAVISSCAQLCLDTPKLNCDLKENFQVIFRNCQRANILIKELLNFARPPEFKWQFTDLNSVVLHMLNMAQLEKSTDRIEFLDELQDDLPEIRADEEKIGQVILNLIQNAAQAIEGYGIVTVRSSFDATNKRIMIVVEDNGSGIAQEYRQRIFDPFFTTKDHGTGLGLSICHTLVQQHGGEINAVFPETGGTAMTINLPTK
jgi:PAS domain S-box-containing protein